MTYIITDRDGAAYVGEGDRPVTFDSRLAARRHMLDIAQDMPSSYLPLMLKRDPWANDPDRTTRREAPEATR